MKKTIITLLALAGVAMADTPLTLLPTYADASMLSKNATNYSNWNKDIGGKIILLQRE